MSRGVDGEQGEKGGALDSSGSLLMTINRLTVMTICDKSLGEESPRRLPAPNQTGYLEKIIQHKSQSESSNDHSGGGGQEDGSIVAF